MRVIEFILLAMLLGWPLVGATENRAVVLDKAVELSFEPVSAFFTVDYGKGNISRVAALVLPDPLVHAKPAEQLRSWLVGARIFVSEEKDQITFTLIIFGNEDKVAFFPPATWNLNEKETFSGSADNLRKYMVIRQEKLRSWNMQVKAQEESLRRLRDDADTIANVSRIVEAQDELKRVTGQVEGLAKDIENLKGFLTLAKNHPQPRNFARREHELTNQLNALSEIAKKVESGAYARRSQVESELQRKFAVIEEARKENPEELQRRLQILRRKRENLEGRSGMMEDEEYGNQRVN